MDQISDTSMYEFELAAPSGRSMAGSNPPTLMTASRRRRLQRRRAAAAQLAAAVEASTSSVGSSRPVDDAAGGNGNYEMEIWPTFDQLVRAPLRSLTVQTERVHVMAAPPVVYHAATQTERATEDVAVGVNVPDRPWPQGLSYDHAIRLTMAQAMSRPEEIVGQLFQWMERDLPGELFVTAHQREYVLGVVRGVAGGLRQMSRDLHDIISRHQDNREAFEEAVRAFIAQTGEFIDRSLS